MGLEGAIGSEGAMGAEGAEGAEEDEGAAIYIVRWLGHHRNRPYCLMGLRSKLSDGWMGDWVIGYPLDCYYC